MKNAVRQQIFGISKSIEFDEIALKIFKYQVVNNGIYKEYITALGISPDSVKSTEKIPFLPVSFFKDHKVIADTNEPVAVFESSGTTGMVTSKHYVTDLQLYEESFTLGFNHIFGDPADYFIAALLPSYSERGNSSLIYMMNNLICKSKFSDSGFYNDNPEKLLKTLRMVKSEGRKAILLGVSFALLDLAEKFSPDLSGVIVVETGGMKGRRKEITRQELHSILKSGFNVKTIHSEYGMTELLSQGWSKGDGLFYCPPWMKILIRDPLDPLTVLDKPGRSGGINIIDLANINSCAFIAVNDLGKLHEDGGFEVLGRFDNSELRGCNLLVD